MKSKKLYIRNFVKMNLKYFMSNHFSVLLFQPNIIIKVLFTAVLDFESFILHKFVDEKVLARIKHLFCYLQLYF
jgi:hypothetical protein